MNIVLPVLISLAGRKYIEIVRQTSTDMNALSVQTVECIVRIGGHIASLFEGSG